MSFDFGCVGVRRWLHEETAEVERRRTIGASREPGEGNFLLLYRAIVLPRFLKYNVCCFSIFVFNEITV